MNAFGGSLPERVWIGGTDEKTEGTWGWITGDLGSFQTGRMYKTSADLAGGNNPTRLNEGLIGK